MVKKLELSIFGTGGNIFLFIIYLSLYMRCENKLQHNSQKEEMS